MKCFNVLDLHYIFYFHFRHPKCYLCLMLTLIFLHVLVLVATPPPQVLSHEDLGKFLRLNQFSLLGSQPISAPHTAACLCPDTAACLCPDHRSLSLPRHRSMSLPQPPQPVSAPTLQPVSALTTQPVSAPTPQPVSAHTLILTN